MWKNVDQKIFLLYVNALPHMSNFKAPKWRTFVFDLVNKPSHTADLAFSDYFLSEYLKKHLKVHHFVDNENVKEVTESWF